MKNYIDIQGQRFPFFVVTEIDLDVVKSCFDVGVELFSKGEELGFSVGHLGDLDAYVLIPNKALENKSNKNITIFAKQHDIPHVIGSHGRNISRLKDSVGKNITVKPYFEADMYRLTAKITDDKMYKDTVHNWWHDIDLLSVTL